MLLWLNGPFGVGKTSAATALVASSTGLRLFDPELVGYLLRANLPDRPHIDFRDLPPWRSLVPRVAAEIAGLTGDTLVVVQTVLSQHHWRELHSGLVREGLSPVMVLLDCEPAELERRARMDVVDREAEEWRLGHVVPYLDARPWLTREAQFVVDTTRLTIPEVAARLLATALTSR